MGFFFFFLTVSKAVTTYVPGCGELPGQELECFVERDQAYGSWRGSNEKPVFSFGCSAFFCLTLNTSSTFRPRDVSLLSFIRYL